MMRVSGIVAMLLVAVFAVCGRPALAANCDGDGVCCDQCGRHVACVQKVCQLVCEVKKETKISWSVECKEFCTLMPGHRDCCDQCQPPPRCGRPICAKKLVKKEYQLEVPVYKCVVRNLCADCCGGQAAASAGAAPSPPAKPPAQRIPPAPSVPTPAPNLK